MVHFTRVISEKLKLCDSKYLMDSDMDCYVGIFLRFPSIDVHNNQNPNSDQTMAG